MAKLEAPWYTYRKKLNALFEADPLVTVSDVYDPHITGIPYAIDVVVGSHEKFIALDRALPYEKQFGNVTMRIFLYDGENAGIGSDVELFKALFNGNPIVKDIRVMKDQVGVEHAYVRFQPDVIQFFDDDLSDYSGNWSGLAQDIAKELFDEQRRSINFCTADLRENGGDTPMGTKVSEWS